jgi:aryl-alcohol dehydrogenase-like predicted oxidoreductase
METATSLVLGTMNFGRRTPPAEAERIVARAVERGITMFDSANAYSDGDSERILGHALKAQRDAVQIATKVGFARIEDTTQGTSRATFRPEGLTKGRVVRAIDESLARLGTDYIDVYYLHVPDHHTPIAETLDAIHALLDAKKIRSWGVSNYASWQILEMNAIADARNMPRPVIAQQLYNLLIRQLDIEYFKFTRQHPIHTTVYNALAGGLLSGKHAPGTELRGSRFENNALYRGRYLSDVMFTHVAALRELASEAGLTLIELAYAWLAQRDGVDSILVGPATVTHLDAAISACEKKVSTETCKRIDELYVAAQGTNATYAR